MCVSSDNCGQTLQKLNACLCLSCFSVLNNKLLKSWIINESMKRKGYIKPSEYDQEMSLSKITDKPMTFH